MVRALDSKQQPSWRTIIRNEYDTLTQYEHHTDENQKMPHYFIKNGLSFSQKTYFDQNNRPIEKR